MSFARAERTISRGRLRGRRAWLRGPKYRLSPRAPPPRSQWFVPLRGASGFRFLRGGRGTGGGEPRDRSGTWRSLRALRTQERPRVSRSVAPAPSGSASSSHLPWRLKTRTDPGDSTSNLGEPPALPWPRLWNFAGETENSPVASGVTWRRLETDPPLLPNLQGLPAFAGRQPHVRADSRSVSVWPQYTCSVSACDLINPAALTSSPQDPDKPQPHFQAFLPFTLFRNGSKEHQGGEGGVSN